MKKILFCAICVMAVVLVGCEPKVPEQKPTVLTLEVTDVTTNSAQVHCNVTLDGGASVLDRGVAYDTYPNPKATGTRCKAGTGTGKYSCNLTDLEDNKKYYVRAYARNEVGIEYGKEISFTTIKELYLPKVSTGEITDILPTSATISGLIVNDGGAEITECGIVWSTSENPTISNDKVIAEDTSEVFQCELTELQEQTTYFVRAYAINEKGAAYGEEVSFTTRAKTVATVTTSTPTNVSSTSAKIDGNVTNDGGTSVTERGVCYSTNANPTTSNTKITSGSGTGPFTCDLTDLQEETTYYARAYAVNEKGTAYGEEISFTTRAKTVATVTTSTPTSVSSTSAKINGNVTDDGGTSVTERGVCYSTDANPTTSNTKITSGSGTGSFTCNLTDLQKGTTYYARAYAVNEKGTAYGEVVSFTTKKPTRGFENGHEWVDLGLSVKWATCNVGGVDKWDSGTYFAWGETSWGRSFSQSTYKWGVGDHRTIYTKYNQEDNKTILEPEDDAATVNWRGSWRMPTDDEFRELREKCTWEWCEDAGANYRGGYKVTSKTNGQSICLYEGSCYDSPDATGKAIGCYYWSNTLYTGYGVYDACALYIDYRSAYVGRTERYCGCCVRAVCP